MERALREMTFEEEYSFLKKEAKELFDKEDKENEPPESHSVVRRALRCIKKLLTEIEPYKEYMDLEEQGLLLRLPLKIGDTVYSVTRDFISEYTICSIEAYNEGFFFCWRCEKGIYINVRGFTNYQIGQDVFLTKTEAEQKLKKMESDRYGKFYKWKRR